MKLAAKLIQNELISPDVSNLRVIGLIQEAMSALNIYYMNTELKKLNWPCRSVIFGKYAKSEILTQQ